MKKVREIKPIETDDIFQKTMYHIKKVKLDKVVLLPVSSQENILVKQ